MKSEALDGSEVGTFLKNFGIVRCRDDEIGSELISLISEDGLKYHELRPRGKTILYQTEREEEGELFKGVASRLPDAIVWDGEGCTELWIKESNEREADVLAVKLFIR